MIKIIFICSSLSKALKKHQPFCPLERVHLKTPTILSIIPTIEIKKAGILLFKGFDGVEYGTISQKVQIPEWFTKKHIPDTCTISLEW